MEIQRNIMKLLENSLIPGKVIVLYGPRQVGKATLVREILYNCYANTECIRFMGIVHGSPLIIGRILGRLVAAPEDLGMN